MAGAKVMVLVVALVTNMDVATCMTSAIATGVVMVSVKVVALVTVSGLVLDRIRPMCKRSVGYMENYGDGCGSGSGYIDWGTGDSYDSSSGLGFDNGSGYGDGASAGYGDGNGSGWPNGGGSGSDYGYG
jgi:hypothetical protein